MSLVSIYYSEKYNEIINIQISEQSRPLVTVAKDSVFYRFSDKIQQELVNENFELIGYFTE